MDRNRMKVALTMTCILSIYIITSRQNIVQSKTSTPAPVRRMIYEYYGKANTSQTVDDLVYITLVNHETDDNFRVRIKHYQGQWESDPYTLYYGLDLNFRNNKSSLESTNENITLIKNSIPSNSTGKIWLNLSAKMGSVINGNVTGVNISEIKFKAWDIKKDPIVFSRLYHAFIISLVYFVTIAALARHFQRCYESQTFAEKSSLYSLGLLELHELAFAIWQLNKAFENNVKSGMDYILISSFWAFSTFMFIHSKLIPVVFRAQISNSSSIGLYTSARMVSRYQSRMFLSCMVGVFLLIILGRFYMITLPFLFMFFVPQIITNSLQGHKDSYELSVVNVILMSKIVITLYIAGCPKNFMKYEPNYQLCVNLAAILVFQLAVMYYQRFWPRFLVPKRYRPMSYDYFKSKREEIAIAENNENVCTICLTQLNVRVANQENVVNLSKTMHAPCSHRFHKDCLLQWMTIKMECPTCRSKLPPCEE